MKQMKLWKNFIDSHKNRYQNKLQSMTFREVPSDCARLLYYKCHKISFIRGGSYIDSPDWIKNKNCNNKSYL